MRKQSVYEEAVTDKQLAAKILIPLIEFEFAFMTDDSPSLVQAISNQSSINAIFQVCKQHGWTTTEHLMRKGKANNPYFRIPTSAFREIYTIAGPFADDRKHQWARLIVERSGNIGGYRKGTQKTADRVRTLLLTEPDKFWTIYDICLALRLLPSTVREGVRQLYKSKLLERRREGKTVFWKIR